MAIKNHSLCSLSLPYIGLMTAFLFVSSSTVMFGAMTKHGGLRPSMIQSPLEGAFRKVSEMADPYLKTRVLTEMAKKCSLAQQRGMARDILRTARETSLIIPVTYDQVWAMANIAREFARAGEPTRAMVLFAKANAFMVASSDKIGRDTMFLEMGKLCAEARLYEQAYRISENIDDFYSRSTLVSQIGQGLVLKNEYKKPIEMMERLVGRPNRSFVQAELAIAFAKAGKVKRSLELANQLLDNSKRAQTLSAIALSELENGRLTRTIEIADSLAESNPLAVELKCKLYLEIAADLKTRGEFARGFSTLAKARKLARTIVNQTEKAKCIAVVGSMHMSSNQTMRASWVIDEALRELGKIRPEKERLEAVLWTSSLMAKSGEKDEAWDLAAQVADQTKRVKNTHGERDYLYSKLVDHYLSYKRYDLAHKTARKIKKPQLMLEKYSTIGEHGICNNRCNVAEDIAKEITRGRHQGRLRNNPDLVLTGFASAYIQNGLFCKSLLMLRRIDASSLRAVGLSELSAQYAWFNRVPTQEESYQIRHIASKLVFVHRPRQNGDCHYFFPPRGINMVKRPDSTPANALTHHMER